MWWKLNGCQRHSTVNQKAFMGPKIFRSADDVAVHAWLPAMHACRSLTGIGGLENLETP